MINPLLINPKHETNKIINFLQKTFKEQKIDKVVFGLSGGIDSMTVLYLLREVFPAKNIYAVQMDYFPREKTTTDLKEVNFINISIKKIVEEFNKSIMKVKIPFLRQSLGAPFGVKRSKKTVSSFQYDNESKIRLGNIMVRVRMIMLFDLAKKLNAMVSGTENKSERLLGYFTRFGDAASDIEPIAYLYKTQVLQLAKYLKVPQDIIDQSPTAGLWEGQTDEDEFGFTYKEADQVLYLMDGRLQDINKIKSQFSNAEKIIKRVQANQFKLQTPYHLK